MDVAPLNLAPSNPVRTVPPVVAAGGNGTVTESWHGGEAAAPPAPPAAKVGVEYAQRSDGVAVMTFVDMRTGVVISRTPPQQVLAVVDSIVAAIQQREG